MEGGRREERKDVEWEESREGRREEGRREEEGFMNEADGRNGSTGHVGTGKEAAAT